MKKKAFRAALPYSLPICIGFLFIAMSYGFLMRSRGFSVFYPMAMSAFIFAGSMEFVAVELLLSAYAPLHAFLLTLMVNARHLFYGVSLLETYRAAGALEPYLVFSMTDETFSVNVSAHVPRGVDKNWFLFWVSLLDHVYWVAASALGSVLGGLLTIDTKGIEFVMTALFVTIFTGQWMEDREHRPALTGVGASVVCLAVFGADRFILPAMGLIVLVLVGMRRTLDAKEAYAG